MTCFDDICWFYSPETVDYTAEPAAQPLKNEGAEDDTVISGSDSHEEEEDLPKIPMYYTYSPNLQHVPFEVVQYPAQAETSAMMDSVSKIFPASKSAIILQAQVRAMLVREELKNIIAERESRLAAEAAAVEAAEKEKCPSIDMVRETVCDDQEDSMEASYSKEKVSTTENENVSLKEDKEEEAPLPVDVTTSDDSSVHSELSIKSQRLSVDVSLVNEEAGEPSNDRTTTTAQQKEQLGDEEDRLLESSDKNKPKPTVRSKAKNMQKKMKTIFKKRLPNKTTATPTTSGD